MKISVKGILLAAGSIIGLLVVGLSALAFFMSGPLSHTQIKDTLTKEIKNLQINKKLKSAGIAILSPTKKLNLEIGGPPKDKTFHIASVGKLFTSVLIARKIESGALNWNSSIESLLGKDVLKGLVQDADLERVNVADLLAHTSGMADYFSGSTHDGSATVAEKMVANPDKFWTPGDLLEHSRLHQKPGIRSSYLYSDTGFIVLGLLVEQLYMMSFTEAVHQELFEPLGMNDTYYPERSHPFALPAKPLAASWLGESDLSGKKSLSADWAGGGVASTMQDLQRFAQALSKGRLVKPETLASMSETRNKFETGIHYGLGIMTLHFGEFFPLLSSLPVMTGHMGVLGTQLFVDTQSGTTIIVNIGADGQMETSVRLLISALSLLRRIQD